MSRFDRLIRIADRLAEVEAGSAEANRTIHDTLGRSGRVLPYTTDEAAARTLPLSMCGAAMRAWAMLAKG